MYQGNYYSQFRPTYPASLLNHLLAHCETTQRAWDCCTGNGQLAYLLAEAFREVLASDISFSQLAFPKSRSNIRFRLENVLDAPHPEESQDLVTIAQALHWLDRSRFYALVFRVLKPGGVLAILNYRFSQDPHLAGLTRFFIQRISNAQTLEMLTPIEKGYAADRPPGLTFLDSRELPLAQHWDLEQYIGFLKTISVTNKLEPEAYRRLLLECRERARNIWRVPGEALPVQRPLRVDLFKKTT